jgi:hypothetical protein
VQNFQAPLYGTFSDNRPDLALPHFHVVENHVELGQWRASMAKWGDSSTLWGGPGFWTQSFGPQFQLANDTNGLPPWPKYGQYWRSEGTGFVEAGYQGIETPNVLSPWPNFYVSSDLGQRWCAGFTAKMLCDYYDFTLNQTFLEERAYPYVRLVGDFYMSCKCDNQQLRLSFPV